MSEVILSDADLRYLRLLRQLNGETRVTYRRRIQREIKNLAKCQPKRF